MEANNNKNWFEKLFSWVPGTAKTTLEYIETALILLYIFNGVVTFLILFGFVPASDGFKRLAGSLAFAFSMFALLAFVNKGVKHNTNVKKGKR